jgi:hypothetical protein
MVIKMLLCYLKLQVSLGLRSRFHCHNNFPQNAASILTLMTTPTGKLLTVSIKFPVDFISFTKMSAVRLLVRWRGGCNAGVMVCEDSGAELS